MVWQMMCRIRRSARGQSLIEYLLIGFALIAMVLSFRVLMESRIGTQGEGGSLIRAVAEQLSISTTSGDASTLF